MTAAGEGPGLAARAARGDEDARSSLLLELAPLVRQAARRFAPSGAPLPDLEQAGYLGILKALSRYDPSRATPFAAFAAPFVLAEMREAAQELLPGPELGRRAVRRLREARAAEERLLRELGRAPSVREVAAAIGVASDELAALLAAARPPGSLSAAADGEEEPRGLAPEPAVPSFEEAWLTRAEARLALARLPERERRVLVLRYVAGLSQAEAARRLGVSQPQVSRIERRALALARAALEGRAV